MPRTSYDAIFNSIDDLLDPLIQVPNTDGGLITISKATWDSFNAWCDFIHIDIKPDDPEIISYNREI
jgi:hypothetical protein